VSPAASRCCSRALRLVDPGVLGLARVKAQLVQHLAQGLQDVLDVLVIDQAQVADAEDLASHGPLAARHHNFVLLLHEAAELAHLQPLRNLDSRHCVRGEALIGGESQPQLLDAITDHLADALVADRRGAIGSRRELASYLDESWRIEMGRLKELDRDLLDELAKTYRSRKVRLLASLVGSLKKEGKG